MVLSCVYFILFHSIPSPEASSFCLHDMIGRLWGWVMSLFHQVFFFLILVFFERGSLCVTLAVLEFAL